MPVAIPTWRKVLLIPDAIPARAASTTPIATEAIPGLVIPMPIPATIEPASRVVQLVADLDPVHQRSARARPGSARSPMIARAGTRLKQAGPRSGATTNESTVSGRKRRPASSGE